MRDKAIVTEIRGKTVYVVPLISDACIGCSSTSCSKASSPFPASNPLKLPVKVSSLVKISAEVRQQAFQAFTALLLPIAAAVGGYIGSGAVLESMGIEQAEGIKASAVLVCLFVSAGLVMFFTNKSRRTAQSIITEILLPEADVPVYSTNEDEPDQTVDDLCSI